MHDHEETTPCTSGQSRGGRRGNMHACSVRVRGRAGLITEADNKERAIHEGEITIQAGERQRCELGHIMSRMFAAILPSESAQSFGEE